MDSTPFTTSVIKIVTVIEGLCLAFKKCLQRALSAHSNTKLRKQVKAIHFKDIVCNTEENMAVHYTQLYHDKTTTLGLDFAVHL